MDCNHIKNSFATLLPLQNKSEENGDMLCLLELFLCSETEIREHKNPL